MQELPTTASSAPDFAGFLAALAAPPNPEPATADDGLADDVANISYEHALRTHARSRAWAVESDPNQTESLAATPEPTGAPKRLKKASITIRLSEAECAQLRLRAGETGLTVSAYLRSCTLEVESLRAQVKNTLAELRNSPPPAEKPEKAQEPSWLRSILLRLRRWGAKFGRRPQPPYALNPANPFAPAR